MMLEQIYLKPCPFCGGDAGFMEFEYQKRREERSRIRVEVGCLSCAAMEFECDSLYEAAERWNRRDETHYFGSTVESEEMPSHEKRCAYICERLLDAGALRIKLGRTWNGFSFSWLIKTGKLDPHEVTLQSEISV